MAKHKKKSAGAGDVPPKKAPPGSAEPRPKPKPKPEPARVRPTPVRRSLGVDPVVEGTPARVLELDGKRWNVTTIGRSSGGRTLKNLDLVELEFAPVDDDGPTVTRLLASAEPDELSDLQLEELLGTLPSEE